MSFDEAFSCMLLLGQQHAVHNVRLQISSGESSALEFFTCILDDIAVMLGRSEDVVVQDGEWAFVTETKVFGNRIRGGGGVEVEGVVVVGVVVSSVPCCLCTKRPRCGEAGAKNGLAHGAGNE